jgi:phosphoribosylamine--glycine ligase
MSVIDGDLAEALHGAATGRLDPRAITPAARHAVCVVLAAAGYPGSPRTGDPIRGLDAAARIEGVVVHHAGTKLSGGEIVTSGGRVLGITGCGATLAQAHARAYRAADLVLFEGRQLRRDIAARALGPR